MGVISSFVRKQFKEADRLVFRRWPLSSSAEPDFLPIAIRLGSATAVTVLIISASYLVRPQPKPQTNTFAQPLEMAAQRPDLDHSLEPVSFTAPK